MISAATRLQGIFFWDLVIYLIEGLLFLLTGFQMRLLFEKSKAFPLDDILIATALVTVMIVVTRFAWVFPATYLPRLIKRVRVRDPSPPWQWVFVLSFTGVRGAVSLAAALALPFALPGGEAFPYRDLILFVSFGVIFITLVGFGLGLPPVVRWLGVAQAGRAEHVAELESEIAARREALGARSSRSTPSPTTANYPTRWSSCCARGTKPAPTSCRIHSIPMPMMSRRREPG